MNNIVIIYHTNIIIELFYSQLFSAIKCPDCSYISMVFNPICYHTLPIPNKTQNITLHDCYQMFTDENTPII